MPSDKLSDLIKSFKEEEVALRTQISEISLYMGGGCELNTAWGLSFSDREILIRLINKKIKAESTSKKEYL